MTRGDSKRSAPLSDARSDSPASALKAALAGVKQTLEAARAQAAQAKRDADEQAQRLGPSDAELFEQSVHGTKPLRAQPRTAHPPEHPLPEPRQRWLDEQAALKEAWSDELDVSTLLDTDEALSFHRAAIGPDVPRKLRRGEWAVQAELDLHGLTREAARDALVDFLQQVEQRGARCVRVVHGKGTGSPGRMPVLKGKVRAWLVQDQRVIAFVQAPRAQGGNGAVLVLLR